MRIRFSWLVFLVLCLPVSGAETDTLSPSTEGFYPLWEGTGRVERHRSVFLGTTGSHIGLFDVAQIGVQPLPFIYRVPNGYGKFALLNGPDVYLSVQLGAYYLLENSGRGSFSPMYPSRLDNLDFGLMLVPVSASLSLPIGDWLELHQTATALTIRSRGPLENETRFGYALMAEFFPESNHAAVFHLGEVGIHRHDFWLAGISYRYRNSWIELRLGYFYRFYPAGAQSAPMIGIGILL